MKYAYVTSLVVHVYFKRGIILLPHAPCRLPLMSYRRKEGKRVAYNYYQEKSKMGKDQDRY